MKFILLYMSISKEKIINIQQRFPEVILSLLRYVSFNLNMPMAIQALGLLLSKIIISLSLRSVVKKSKEIVNVNINVLGNKYL